MTGCESSCSQGRWRSRRCASPPILFNRLNVKQFEEGQPKNKFSASLNWKLSRFGATLRATRYGDALFNDGNNPLNDFVMSAKTLIDLEGRFELTDNIKFAIGAENVADEYPDPLPLVLNTTGTSAYANYSPFGRSGRFVYGRATFSF